MFQAKFKEIWDFKEWIVLCMDIQQIYMCPKTLLGSAFYKRKLNVYNFWICEVKKKEPYFYLWEEFSGRKGSAEIYSCVYKRLQEHVFIKEEQQIKLWIIADNFGGQNKKIRI